MNAIDKFRDQVKRKLQENPILGWREEIPQQKVEQLRQQHAPKSRKRIWHLEIMLWFWLTAGIYRERSFNAVISEVWVPLCAHLDELSGIKINPGRMAEGRARVPEPLLRAIREELAQKGVQEGCQLGLWRGRRVLWLDGSTASMPDEPELWNHFGGPSNQHGRAPFPVARMVNLGVAATRIVIGHARGPYRTSEKELSLPLIQKLQAGDVLTADRYFSSAEILAWVKLQGADAVMRKHPQLKLHLHKCRQVGPEDWIVELEIPLEARQAHPELPPTIEVRVFHIVLGYGANRQDLWMQTTLLDPQQYPKEELAKLYLSRWGAETHYAEVKVELHVDILRSKTLEGVEREIEAHLASYNYVRLQMLRAAKQAGVDPRELSFLEAVRTILKFGELMRTCQTEPSRALLLERMLRQIAAAKIRPRPGRHEPRAVKRAAKPFPRFKGSRQEWRKQNVVIA